MTTNLPAYIGRRLLAAVPLLLGIATLIFVLVRAAPGDPATLLIGPSVGAEVAEQTRRNLGLDQPLAVQYVRWIASLATGDLGHSVTHRMPVSTVLRGALFNTMLLSGCALLLSFALGIIVGTVQAAYQHSWADRVLSVVILFFYSMPGFWLALMFVIGLSLYARTVWDLPIWFPASGISSSDYASLSPVGRILDRLWHLALPVLTLTLILSAAVARFMRTAMLDVIRQDFVRTARSKGLRERDVLFRHGLRNALAPIFTLIGLQLPFLLSGTVLVEIVFAWPGMGRAMVDAIGTRDYPLVMGASFLFAASVVLANLVADVLYALADPRIRYE